MSQFSKLLASLLLSTLVLLTNAQDGTPTPTPSPSLITTVIGGTTTSYRPIFTMPASSDEGAPLLPNIQDSEAIDAQNVCPGYKASLIEKNRRGFTAILKLAGEPCNVYGNDVEVLKLIVEEQSAKRLAVNISPLYIVSNSFGQYIDTRPKTKSSKGLLNSSQYTVPDSLLQRPKADAKHKSGDLQFHCAYLTLATDPYSY